MMQKTRKFAPHMHRFNDDHRGPQNLSNFAAIGSGLDFRRIVTHPGLGTAPNDKSSLERSQDLLCPNTVTELSRQGAGNPGDPFRECATARAYPEPFRAHHITANTPHCLVDKSTGANESESTSRFGPRRARPRALGSAGAISGVDRGTDKRPGW